MSRVLVAGVDTSTQSTKVRVTDAETGEMVRFGQAKHPDGTSVNPDAWWQAFQEAAEQAGGLDDVAALAVGGQQHGMVLLDDHGRVIRDALLWNDTRSATNADVLIARLGEAEKATDGSEDDLSDDPAMRGHQRWVKAVGSSLVERTGERRTHRRDLPAARLAELAHRRPRPSGRGRDRRGDEGEPGCVVHRPFRRLRHRVLRCDRQRIPP